MLGHFNHIAPIERVHDHTQSGYGNSSVQERERTTAHGRNQAMSELILGAEVSDSVGSGEKEGRQRCATSGWGATTSPVCGLMLTVVAAPPI
jgi:hypothetical protein